VGVVGCLPVKLPDALDVGYKQSLKLFTGGDISRRTAQLAEPHARAAREHLLPTVH